MRGRRGLLASPGLWFALALSGSAAYGVEQWRRNASHRATHVERARLDALVTCLLGDDGRTMVQDPAAIRARLRALAMGTTLDPAPTWLDRCLPLARDLARDGARVDATIAPTRAATQIAARARDLLRALSHVGLVWQIRAGDTETDMERVATLLAQTAAEIDLADAPQVPADANAPRAPSAPELPAMLRVDVPGLHPLPLGDGSSFLVGAPLPSLSRVRLREHEASVEVIANDDARAWRLRPNGFVRILAEDGAPDGLAPLRLDATAGERSLGRMASPPPGVPLSGVSLDATRWGDALWVAHAIRGNAPALARMPLNRRDPITAVRLPAARVGDATTDEEVAVGSDGSAVFAVRTEHDARGDGVTVSAVRARGGARATVLPVVTEGDAWRLAGRHPGLAICPSRATLWLAATARDGWRVGTLQGASLRTVHALPASRARFDEIPTLRCDDAGALLYARDRPRASPVVWCEDGGRCVTLPQWSPPQPVTLPDWTVPDALGNRRPMPEWPMRFARTPRGGFVAARAAGAVVTVARATHDLRAWEPEAVVFDAARTAPGERVESIELYGGPSHLTLVIATREHLHLAVSYDDGARWQRP